MALRTAWTKPIIESGPATRDSGDPLGLRAYATRLSREITPGLTQVTSSTRGFGLLCLGVDMIPAGTAEQDARELFQRVERLWVAADVHQCGDEATSAGKRRAKRILDGLPQSDLYPLTKPILTNQLSAGVWGGYRRAAAAFGLISGADQRSLRLSTVTLRRTGDQLVRQLRRATLEGVNLGAWLKHDGVAREVLGRVRADFPVTQGEVRVLTSAIEGYDDHHDHSLGHLRRVFDARGAVSLDDLDRAPLAGRQVGAVAQAIALRDLIEEVEFPFRAWAVTGTEPTWSKGILRMPIWEIAGAQETDLAALHARISKVGPGGLGAAVLAHHRWLARARGSQPWEVGAGPRSAEVNVLPDFALGALTSLFIEGVAPRVDR